MDPARIEDGIGGVSSGKRADASDASFSQSAVECVGCGSENSSADILSVFRSIGESAGLARCAGRESFDRVSASDSERLRMPPDSDLETDLSLQYHMFCSG